MSQQTYEFAAVGVVPIFPVYFYDFDGTSFVTVMEWGMMEFEDFDIYKTKNGFHLVGDCSSWDEVQVKLNDTKAFFPDLRYINNCRKLRLRISPKWDKKGVPVSPEPLLEYCHCLKNKHHDKRLENCKRVGYYTRTG